MLIIQQRLKGGKKMTDPNVLNDMNSQVCSECDCDLMPENIGMVEGIVTQLCKTCLTEELDKNSRGDY